MNHMFVPFYPSGLSPIQQGWRGRSGASLPLRKGGWPEATSGIAELHRFCGRSATVP